MQLPHVVVPSLPISGHPERFPVRRIYCVGRNYAEHAREMGGDPSREPPFFFSKPADALLETGGTVAYPRKTAELHHEVEMVIALGRGGSDIPVADAGRCVLGYAVGIDLTLRDLQAQAKKAGRPWDLSKGFDQSAPVGALTLGSAPSSAALRLRVDGHLRQEGDVKDMVWNVAEIINALSSHVSLKPGDLIFTGTPAGVGAIGRGQHVLAELSGCETLDVRFLP